MPETIRVEKQDGIATITLDRPDKLNAYTVEMGIELVAAYRELRVDAEVRALILTGAGRGFCAGVDLEVLRAMQAGEATSGPQLGEEEFNQGFPKEHLEYPKPVIAAINGAAVGVGVTMILPCDVRIASENAKLGLPFTKLGILPGLGSTHLLPRIVGLAKAQELVLTARIVTAGEALAMGLVNHVVLAEELLPKAHELASAMAACDPDALALAKAGLHYGAGVSLEEAMANEQRNHERLRQAKAQRGGS